MKRILQKMKALKKPLPKGFFPALAVLIICAAVFVASGVENAARYKRLQSSLDENNRRLEDYVRIARETAEACEGLSRRMDESEAANQKTFASIRADIDYIKSQLRRLASFQASAGAGPRKVGGPEASSLASAQIAGRDESRTSKDTFITATFLKSGEAFERRKYREASDGYHAILRADSENAKAAVYATVADYYLDPKQYDGNAGVKNMMNDYLSKAGDDRIVLKTLAAMSSDDGDWASSSKYFSRLVEGGFADRDDCVLAANASMLAGDVDSGRRYFDAAVAKSPKEANVAFSAGKAFDRANIKDDAVRYYKKALEIDPEYGPAKEALESQTVIGGKTDATN